MVPRGEGGLRDLGERAETVLKFCNMTAWAHCNVFQNLRRRFIPFLPMAWAIQIRRQN